MSVHRHAFTLAIVAALALLKVVGSARAATAEAYRRVDGQGIELIRDRIPAGSPPDALPVATRTTRAAAAPSASGSAPAVVVREARAAVSAREQSQRDKDRLAILFQELKEETAHYQRMRQALDHPALKARSDGEEWRRLSEQRDRHEQNIKALHAEIRRTQPSSVR